MPLVHVVLIVFDLWPYQPNYLNPFLEKLPESSAPIILFRVGHERLKNKME